MTLPKLPCPQCGTPVSLSADICKGCERVFTGADKHLMWEGQIHFVALPPASGSSQQT